jgi:hypothetical protein
VKGFDTVSGKEVKRNQRNRASTSEPRSGSDRVNLGKAQHAVVWTRSNSKPCPKEAAHPDHIQRIQSPRLDPSPSRRLLLPFFTQGVLPLCQRPNSLILRVAFALKAFSTISGSQLAVTTE